MGILINGSLKKYKLLHNGQPLKRAYHNGDVQIWSAGSTVTYVVDTDKTYQEEVDEGETCLSPKTFTPSKSGWTFAGWREDGTASADVLSSKVMGDTPVTLYAVYKKTVTLSYNGNGSTGGSVTAQTGTAYYNGSGSALAASFTLAANGFTKTGCSFSRWALNGTGGTQYAAGAKITLSSSATMYAVWIQLCKITYVYGGKTVNTAYVSKGAAITGYTPTAISGSTFKGWTSSAASTTPQTLTASGDITLYGIRTYSNVSLPTYEREGGSRTGWSFTINGSAYSQISFSWNTEVWSGDGDSSITFTNSAGAQIWRVDQETWSGSKVLSLPTGTVTVTGTCMQYEDGGARVKLYNGVLTGRTVTG